MIWLLAGALVTAHLTLTKTMHWMCCRLSLLKCRCHFLMCCKILTIQLWFLHGTSQKRKSAAVSSTERSEDNLRSHYISSCLLRQAHQFLVSLSRRVTEGTFWGSTKYTKLSVYCSINTAVLWESWPVQPYHWRADFNVWEWRAQALRTFDGFWFYWCEFVASVWLSAHSQLMEAPV